MLGERLENFNEQVDRLLTALTWNQRTTRLSGDVRSTKLFTKRDGAAGVVDSNAAVVFVRLDERRVPVRLAIVGDGVHHEGVDV